MDKDTKDKLDKLAPYVAWYSDQQSNDFDPYTQLEDYLNGTIKVDTFNENPFPLAYTVLEDRWDFEHEVQVMYDAETEAYVYQVDEKTFYEPADLESLIETLETCSSQLFEEFIYSGLRLYEANEYGKENEPLSIQAKQKILAPHLKAYELSHFKQQPSLLYQFMNGFLEAPAISDEVVGLEFYEDLEEWNQEGHFHFVESSYDLQKEQIIHSIDKDVVYELCAFEELLQRLDEAGFDEITFCRSGLDLWEKENLPLQSKAQTVLDQEIEMEDLS